MFGWFLIGLFAALQGTSTVWVSARVENQCRVTGGRLDFGSYNPIARNATAPLDAEGEFQVQCTPGARVSIALDGGQHNLNNARRMLPARGGDSLRYELYSDPSRASAWNADVVLPAATGAPQRMRVFGRIPGGQDVSADAYSDSVLIMVRF